MYQHARNTTTQVQHSQQCTYHVPTCQEYNDKGTTQLAVYIPCTNMLGIQQHRYNIASSEYIMNQHARNKQVQYSQQCPYHVPTRHKYNNTGIVHCTYHVHACQEYNYISTQQLAVYISCTNTPRNKTQIRNSQQCTYHVPTCQKYNYTGRQIASSVHIMYQRARNTTTEVGRQLVVYISCTNVLEIQLHRQVDSYQCTLYTVQHQQNLKILLFEFSFYYNTLC